MTPMDTSLVTRCCGLSGARFITRSREKTRPPGMAAGNSPSSCSIRQAGAQLPSRKASENQLPPNASKKKSDSDIDAGTISLGVTSYHGGEDISAFIERADQALYMAKKLGRNRVICEDKRAEIAAVGI